MRESQRTENINERRSTLTGLIMTLAVHVAAFVLVSFTGLKYIYPPPEEQAMLIDFSVDMETVEQAFNVKVTNHRTFLPGVISRKKQIVPALSVLWG